MNYSKLIIWLVLMSVCHAGMRAGNAQWVMPAIGTGHSHAPTMWGNYGGTYPGAVAPWGMVQLSPETSNRASESGYYHCDSTILCFSTVHHNSGYPNGSHGRIKMAMIRGAVNHFPANWQGRPFSHSLETMQAGYYAVTFADGDRVQATAAAHSGIYSYHTQCHETTIAIYDAGNIEVTNNQEVTCSTSNAVIRFSLPMLRHQLHGDTLLAQFNTSQHIVDVMVMTSATSHAKARKNGEAELHNGNFDAVKRNTYDAWDKELACVDIVTANSNHKRMFYTAFYHSMLMPSNVADAGEAPRFAGFSPWDTFRTLHPLLSLLKPDVQTAITQSMMQHYEQHGILPKGPMTGFHAIAILLDSYVKGATSCSLSNIHRASMAFYNDNRWEQLRSYVQNGYVDARHEKSVSITAELAYDDWAMMKICQLLQLPDSAAWRQRATNYCNLWDAETLFMLPRHSAQGLLRHAGELGYQESTKVTASLFAPHNVAHLVNLSGGEQAFARRLDATFNSGEVIFDNEPVLHYPWLFVWAHRPDLAMKHVHGIANNCFSATPGGIPGNDDLGAMSSWLVFAMLGIMPVCPGTDQYVMVPPMVDAATLHFANGNTLTISHRGNKRDDTMPTPQLGDKALDRWFVTHGELLKGGNLTYDWSRPAQLALSRLPYSLTPEPPQFNVTLMSSKKIVTEPHRLNSVAYKITNTGGDGIYTAALMHGNDTLVSKRIMVAAGATACDTLTFRLYKSGNTRLTFAGQKLSAKVRAPRGEQPRLMCHSIRMTPVAAIGDSVSAAITLQNITSQPFAGNAAVSDGNATIATLPVKLNAGATATLQIKLPALSVGMHSIGVEGCVAQLKVCDDALQTTVLHLDFDAEGQAADRSGFHNHGICNGPLMWSGGALLTGKDAFVELPTSPSLMHPYEQITMLTWMKPTGIAHGYVDFFTKGDYTLLKMQGNKLVCFAGGWGRGQCEATVPPDWCNNWHLVAGVCTGDQVQLYIDARLVATVPVQGTIKATEVPWNLGRNAEMPYSRFGAIWFSGTRIFASALTQAQIAQIYASERHKIK
ncbi:MAG: GH92 family glycosyl hydrolase [Muribaculaceae bacterium]